MPSFSSSSLKKLRTVDSDLQVLFLYVVKHFDCTILSGTRTTEEQQELYSQGRDRPGYIVTYKDGVINKSKHQEALAVDVCPYPIAFRDMDRIKYFAGFVMGIAKILRDNGIIDIEIRNGLDWDNDTELKDNTFTDGFHFEIINN